MAGEMKELYLNSDQVLFRPGQAYPIATTPIFVVIGGPVLIKFLTGVFTLAEVSGAATLDFDVNGVAVTGGPSAALGAAAVGDIVWCPLDGATAVGYDPNTLVITPATPTCFVMASVTIGIIDAIAAVAQIDGMAFSIVYQRLTPASEVVLA
jgi:hypothetical protein